MSKESTRPCRSVASDLILVKTLKLRLQESVWLAGNKRTPRAAPRREGGSLAGVTRELLLTHSLSMMRFVPVVISTTDGDSPSYIMEFW